MAYILLFLLIAGVYVLGAPISNDESLKFRIIECTSNDNDTSSTYVLELTNVNETCIRVNKSSSTGEDIFFFIAPATETGVQVHIKTENCSVPLPEIHLSLCDDPLANNQTEKMVTFKYTNLTLFEGAESDINSTIDPHVYTGPIFYETAHHLEIDTNSTVDPHLYTGPTFYETAHHLDEEVDHETHPTHSSLDFSKKLNKQLHAAGDENEYENITIPAHLHYTDKQNKNADSSSEEHQGKQKIQDFDYIL